MSTVPATGSIPARAANAPQRPRGAAAEAGWTRVLLRLRTDATMLLVAGFIILNAGLMLVRVPPVGVGLPIGEVFIVLFAATFFYDAKYGAGFLRAAPMVPLAIWWTMGLVHIIFELPQYGFWVIRDAAHWMETTFLWIGFVLASRPGFWKKLTVWVRRTFDIALVYTLCYPFRGTLGSLSPKLTSISGYSAPLLFTYINGPSCAITGLFRVLMTRSSTASLALKLAIGAGALAVVIMFLQTRTAYIQLVAMLGLLAVLKPQRLSRMGAIVVVGGVLGALLLSLNLNLAGASRINEQFTLDFLWNHIQAIWGGGDKSVKDAAAGVDLRLTWWIDLFHRVNETPLTSLFGLGFGVPLTRFMGMHDDVAREVHNSFMSVYGRLGLIGLLCFLAFHIKFYFTSFRLMFLMRGLGRHKVVTVIGTMTCMMGMNVIFSLFEGGFEVSYVAIPYYFLAGVILAIDQQIRRDLAAGRM